MEDMKRIGAWLIGARGSIGAVTIAGQSAIRHGHSDLTGLVTGRKEFEDAGLVPVSSFVFGGHDIHATPLPDVARTVFASSNIPPPASEILIDLAAADSRIRPGIVRGINSRNDTSSSHCIHVSSDLDAIDAVKRDLETFRREHRLTHVIVVNLGTTEAVPASCIEWENLEGLQSAMAGVESVVPTSTLYAYAAIDCGCAYLNFTPSLGSDIPAIRQLADERRTIHMGCDGKTGETLIKSVLAELFVRRNLPVLSWFGQNILGNSDGRALENPTTKASKLRTKEHLLGSILGYPTDNRVGIDYVASLGEWKIAWDHIHFAGFLGGRMSMEFTWRGVDSLLAAPLVLDLIRLCSLALDRGETGILTSLASFFKRPMGTDEGRLVTQDDGLISWIRNAPKR